MKAHMVLVRNFAFVGQKNIEAGHFKRVFGLVGQALALQPAQELGNAALGDAKAFSQATHMDAFAVALKPGLDLFEELPGDVTFENVQARIRGTLITSLANRAGALVLNTGNKSEGAMPKKIRKPRAVNQWK